MRNYFTVKIIIHLSNINDIGEGGIVYLYIIFDTYF